MMDPFLALDVSEARDCFDRLCESLGNEYPECKIVFSPLYQNDYVRTYPLVDGRFWVVVDAYSLYPEDDKGCYACINFVDGVEYVHLVHALLREFERIYQMLHTDDPDMRVLIAVWKCNPCLRREGFGFEQLELKTEGESLRKMHAHICEHFGEEISGQIFNAYVRKYDVFPECECFRSGW